MLLPPPAKLLLAISGGPDSIVLGHLLRSSVYTVYWGHVDHQLRKTSIRDARFVKTLAHSWGIPCAMAKVSVRSWARKKKVSLEEAARDQRYILLEKMARKFHCEAIVTAHHADDQAETVLFNFLRGTGPKGLAGIPSQRVLPSQKHILLRPMLSIPRETILHYAYNEKLSFCQDESNDDQQFMRNHIRHHWLPLLEKEFPGLKTRLGQMAELFRQEDDYWEKEISGIESRLLKKIRLGYRLDLLSFLGYHRNLGSRILRRVMTDLAYRDIDTVYTHVFSSHSSFELVLPNEWRVVRQGRWLMLFPKGGRRGE